MNKITIQQTKRVGKRLGVNWGKVDLDQLAMGMNTEMEHKDVTKGNLEMTAKIALSHLKEDARYYTKLKKAGL